MRKLAAAAATILAISLAVAALIGAVTAAPAWSAASEPGYPRLGLWWPDKSYPMDIGAVAKHDWVCLEDWSKADVAKIHAADPLTKVLDSSNAAELRYDPAAGPTDPMNFELAAASPQWILTQLGTTLSSNVDGATNVIPVADASRFAVGDLAVCENEIMHVESVGSGSITVQRDWLKPGSSHPAGVRIAPAYEQWPGSVTMDLTDRCPRVDVGHGPEDWAQYNARIGYQLTQTAAWDGLYVDVSNGDKADNVWNGPGSHRRSIDYTRSNTPVASYAAFNAAWDAGLTSYQTQLRALLPDKVILTNGSYPDYAQMNGTAFEAFPDSNGGQYGAPWGTVMFGPVGAGSVTDWTAKSGTPNMTTLLTYGDDTGSGTTVDYQKMRFGLGSALVTGAYFSYAPNQHLLGASPLPWFDEYDNAGAGRGYLGQPLAPAQQAVSGAEVWRRDFENGIVLVNGTSSPVTLDLGGSFKKIKGTQVPAINDGSTVSAVTLQARDAIILLRLPSPTSPGAVTSPAPSPAPVVTSPTPTPDPAPAPASDPAAAPVVTPPAPAPVVTPPAPAPAPDPTPSPVVTPPDPAPAPAPAPDPETAPTATPAPDPAVPATDAAAPSASPSAAPTSTADATAVPAPTGLGHHRYEGDWREGEQDRGDAFRAIVAFLDQIHLEY